MDYTSIPSLLLYLRAVVRKRFRLPPREAILRTSFAPGVEAKPKRRLAVGCSTAKKTGREGQQRPSPG